MKAKTLYVFRHGQTDFNREGKAHGRLDIPLNEIGRAQARELAAALSDAGLEVIYSSPMSRTRETAEIVAERHKGAEIRTHDGLKERDVGVMQGRVAETEFPDLYQKMYDPDFAPPGGGESFNDTRRRVLGAVMEIVKTTERDTIGLSLHGGAMRGILQTLTGSAYPPHGVPNTAYYRMAWDGERLTLDGMPEWLAEGIIE